MEELLKSARIRHFNGSVFACGFPQNQLVTSVQRVMRGKMKSIGRRFTSPFEWKKCNFLLLSDGTMVSDLSVTSSEAVKKMTSKPVPSSMPTKRAF